MFLPLSYEIRRIILIDNLTKKMSDKTKCRRRQTTKNEGANKTVRDDLLFPFDTPSESEDTFPSDNGLYLNIENEISYICGSDVLIGASETIETDLSPVLEINSSHIFPSSMKEDTLNYTSEHPQETPDLAKPSKNNKRCAKKHLVKRASKKPASSSKISNDKKKVPRKRGRKPHFGCDTKPRCSMCSKTFTNTTSLRNHMLIHSGERPYQCEFCEKAFARTTILNIHRRLHTGEKPYKCKSCPCHFITKEALTRHVSKDHSDKNTPSPSHICEVCKKSLCSKYSLRAHMNIHRLKENEDPDAGVECRICLKRFTCRYTLQRHMFEIHNRRGILTCDACAMSFASKWEYSRHQDKHAPNKKYHCEQCSAKFGRKFELLYHLQIHEAEKNSNFTCYLCNKKFTSRESFMDHARSYVQRESEIYSCPQCPLSFSDPRQLKMHINEAHKLPVISDLNYCDICKLVFLNSTDYYEHLFKRHDKVQILCNDCSCNFKSRRRYDEHLMTHVS